MAGRTWETARKRDTDVLEAFKQSAAAVGSAKTGRTT